MKDVQVGDYFIPAGRLVCVSAWVMGNDPDLVKNPEEVWHWLVHIDTHILSCSGTLNDFSIQTKSLRRISTHSEQVCTRAWVRKSQ